MTDKMDKAYWEPTWENQLREARKLPLNELQRHASVSKNNRHRCKDCFCCAALTVLEERQPEPNRNSRYYEESHRLHQAQLLKR